MKTKIARPALMYPGGKFRLSDWILSHFVAHKTYVEPYGGGGSILLSKAPASVEIYNDVNSEIVNFFRVLRDPATASELIRQLELTPYARDEFFMSREKIADPIESARRLAVRSCQACNPISIFRPTGFRRKAIRRDPQHWQGYVEGLKAVSDRLRNVIVENCDALRLMREVDTPETLVYADPPYQKKTKTHAKTYSNEMSDEDHRNLAATLRSLKSYVVLSGYPSKLYDELFEGWEMRTKETHTFSYAEEGTKRTECVWLSPRTSEALKERDFSIF